MINKTMPSASRNKVKIMMITQDSSVM